MSRELLVAGQLFAGRYRIERFLAEGGFGAVYVAEQLATEARVAVKVLWPHVLQAKDAVEKFEQEARIAGRVNSEHIVRVVDAGYDEATEMPFMVMELLIGEDLGHTVERQGALAPDLVVEYLRQTASALDRAHGYKDRDGALRPIIHRDLKPENLFVARRDNGETVIKVLDFGIAKVLGATSNVSQEVKGTPLYMAFEQAGVGTISPRTDVWALGLIAFYILTGQSYWRTANTAEGSLTQLFGEVLSLPIVPPSQRLTELGRPANLPAAFDPWFLGCVNRDPDQRFASAGAAIAALGEVFGIVAVGSRSAPSLTGLPALGDGRASFATPVAAAVTHPSGSDVGTLLSARPLAGTVTALAVSGNVATPSTKRSGLIPSLAVLGGLVVLAVIVVVVFARANAGTPAAGADTAVVLASTPPPPSDSAGAVEVTPATPPLDSAVKTPDVASAKPAVAVAETAKAAPPSKPSAPTPSAAPTASTKPTTPLKDPSLYGER